MHRSLRIAAALQGDSTALFDAGNQRYLTIHPDGKTGRDFRLEAVSRPNSEIWVLRTRKPGDDIPTYDVFDAAGRVIGKVVLSPAGSLHGDHS